jgi:hypothetical protein
MCLWDITRYSCKAETAALIDRCPLLGSCLPHIRQTLHTTATCNLCVEAFWWREHDAVMEWVASEKERLESIAEVEEGGSDESDGKADVILGATQGDVIADVEDSSTTGAMRGNGNGKTDGLRARSTTL